MNRLVADQSSLEALFDVEMLDNATVDDVVVSKALCWKCKGRGNFIGYSGRVVGKCFTCDGTGLAKEKIAVVSKMIDVSRIKIAFEAARANGIKRPKLRLGDFQFSRAPDAGRNAGSIYVKEGEQYLGKIIDGQFYAVRECGSEREAQVIEVASDPSKAAKAYGLRTGECSCCGRTLTNGVSIELGIGPICAEKYGW